MAEADYMHRVCQGCPVQSLCLTVKPENAVGVWGGYLFGELNEDRDTYVPTRVKAPEVAQGSANKYRKVLEVVRQNPGIRTPEVQRLARLTKGATNNALWHLRQQNRVRSETTVLGRRREVPTWYVTT